MPSTFTPITAQSSDEASLITSGMLCDVGPVTRLPFEPEPPQAASTSVRPASSAPNSAPLDILRCMANSLCLVHRRLRRLG